MGNGRFVIGLGSGWLIVKDQAQPDVIAIVNGRAYMNNAIAIVIAAQYFDASLLLVVTLSKLP